MASPKPVTKKIINSPESCVDENLRGIVAAYPRLHLHPKHRVITVRRKDDSKRVAVMGGGGSGHEPFASGYVGSGMLDGAVAGGVFASPPTGHVLYGITHLYKYNSGGVILIIGNYTGDRLNFGKAIEKAKMAGIKVEGLIVGEDVASSHNKTGGRSMVGEVIFYKLCGGMSLKGYDLCKIRDIAAEANKNMATLGVCLRSCSLPGQPPLFEVASDEMELGAGVHGEAGVATLKMGTAKEVVAMIIDKIIAHLKLVAGGHVAVMINNLGSTSVLEMNIISAETKEYFESKQIKVARLYTGHLKTALEMHAFQICVLHLNEQYGQLWQELLDLPAGAASWPGRELSLPCDEPNDDDDSLMQGDGRKASSGPALSPHHQIVLRGCLASAAQQLINNEALLNKLDSGCGDGDCGNTLKKFGHAILSYIEKASLEYVSNVLWDLAEMAERDMGGTSGGIYSLGLSAASQAIALAKNIDASVWLAAWRSAMAAITKYGGAEPGDRTMLDTLHAAAAAFEKGLSGELNSLLADTAAAADQAAKDTANLAAKAGRASYVATGYTRDEDAGARAAAVWLTAILHHIKNHI